jgi:hypothetical protein
MSDAGDADEKPDDVAAVVTVLTSCLFSTFTRSI